MKHEVYLPDEQALLALAGSLAQAWLQQEKRSLLILLRGDLGAGKTTFARGFLQRAGVRGVVKSPTYTLVEAYEPVPGWRCYHFDLYRLAEAEELEFTGARDYFDSSSLCLVEWPEKAGAYLPQADIECLIECRGEGRFIRLESASERGNLLLEQLNSDYSL